MPHVVEVNCLEQLQQYRLVWASLFQRTRKASFCQTLDWFDAFVHADEANVSPRVLIVTDDDDEPLGILPLVVREERTQLGPMRVLGYPTALDLARCGPVGPMPTVTLLEGLAHVARTPRDWHLLDLRGIDADGSDGRRTTAAMNLAGMRPKVEPWHERNVVALGDDWNDYWQSRDAGGRGRIEHLKRKLARRGTVEYVRHRPRGAMYGDDDPRWDLFTDCLTAARRSWQAATPDGVTLTTPAWAGFFREMHEAAARTGALDMNLLYVDGAPAAFAYNYVGGGTLTRIAMGHATGYAEDGVGSVLTAMMLRESHARGDRTIDFGPSNDDWKQFWATDRTKIYRASYCSPRALRPQMLRWGRSLRRQTVGTA